jgi:nucleotide-binding universal stress UspA family protein
MGVPPTPLRQWGRHQARRVLRQAKERVRAVAPNVRPYDEQMEGPATAALLKAAEESELLVLGSRGLSGVTGFLVGSVAQGVVARATRPVVLVRADEEAADEHLPTPGGRPSILTGYRDVVLGVDLGDPCDAVIEFAFEAARLRGARLRVVHAWQPPSPLGLGPGEIGLVSGPQRAEEWLGFLSAVLQVWRDKYPGVEVAETVAEGRAQSALLRAASGAGLLVVGRHLTDRPAGRASALSPTPPSITSAAPWPSYPTLLTVAVLLIRNLSHTAPSVRTPSPRPRPSRCSPTGSPVGRSMRRSTATAWPSCVRTVPGSPNTEARRVGRRATAEARPSPHPGVCPRATPRLITPGLLGPTGLRAGTGRCVDGSVRPLWECRGPHESGVR